MDKILVVDDDSRSLKNVAYFLCTEGYEVDEASNGNEAAQLLDEDGFDLVLSDVIMPGCNGLQLLEHTRSVAPHVPVLLMSAFPNMEVDQIIERGAADFIAKPLEFDELLSKVKRALEQKSAGCLKSQS
jgi:DNA-binding NtrC family response regulator